MTRHTLEFPKEPRLPQACLPRKEQLLSTAGSGSIEHTTTRSQRFTAPDEGRRADQEFVSPDLLRVAEDLDLGDEAIAPASHRTKQRLPLAVVAHRSTNLFQQTPEGSLTDRGPSPERFEDFVFRDHPSGIANEKREEKKGLGLDRPRLVPSPQFACVDIQLVVAESVDHESSR